MSLSGLEPAFRKYPHLAWDAATRLRVLFILGALPAAAIALFAPKAIALPAASLLSITLATLVTLYAWYSRVSYRSPKLTFWDLAGMFAFIGFGAGALSEPSAALELFGMSITK